MEKCLVFLGLILYPITDMGVNLIVDMVVGVSSKSCRQQDSILLFLGYGGFYLLLSTYVLEIICVRLVTCFSLSWEYIKFYVCPHFKYSGFKGRMGFFLEINFLSLFPRGNGYFL